MTACLSDLQVLIAPHRLSSLSSQHATHKTGLEIAALDINQDKTHAIIAGREILKTVHVSGTKCAEDFNLRSAIINYASHNTSGGVSTRQRDTTDLKDVKWSHGSYSTYIATAATSGKVILYDVNRTGVELARLHEHHRQVHKLAFDPHAGYLLLSGSQDGTVRLWDLRDLKKDQANYPSREKFAGQSEGVRDVRWSPTDAMEFAFATDAGVVQRWDFRNPRKPLLKINAHDKACHAIDWHPDGKHLLSASLDRSVRIWDFASDARRQKPAWVLRTPFPVYNARWRPACWHPQDVEPGGWQCTQFATSYDRAYSVMHIWDFRRQFLPFREMHTYNTAPTDFLWQSRDLLWTVGREGVFTQTDTHFVPKVIDRRNFQAIAVSATGEIGGFVQDRPRRRLSGPDYQSSEDLQALSRHAKRDSPEKSSLSRGSLDDSVDESFLSSSSRRHHGRTASNRSARSLGNTPPSHDGKMLMLDDALSVQKEPFKLRQVAFRGLVPGSVNTSVFTYLAQKYKAIALPEPITLESMSNLDLVFEQNAEYAQRASYYRLAQTWRIIGYCISKTVQQRALARRKWRVAKKTLTTNVQQPGPKATFGLEGSLRSPVNPAIRALQTLAQSNQAPSPSTSNVPTPLARPYLSHTIGTSYSDPVLPDISQAELSPLPPAITVPPRKPPHNDPIAEEPSPTTKQSLSGSGWRDNMVDIEERRARISGWRVQPKVPLDLQSPHVQPIDIRQPPPLGRHNSAESFAMFSASGDSHRGQAFPESFASGKSSYRASIGDSTTDQWQDVPIKSSKNSLSPDRSRRHPQARRHDHEVHIHPSSIESSFGPDRGVAGFAPVEHSEASSSAGGIRSPPTMKVIPSSMERHQHDIEALRRNNKLLRHDSSESEVYSNGTGSRSASDASMQSATSETMAASGTIVPQHPILEDRRSSIIPQSAPPTLRHFADSAPAAASSGPPANDALHLDDYLTTEQGDWDNADKEKAFTIVRLLERTLAFHTSVLSDAQSSSLFLLLLAPLLPPNQPLSKSQTGPTLAHFAEILPNLGLSPSHVSTILNTQITHLLTQGIQPLQAEAILSTYHSQLHSFGLLNAATELRRLAYPTYPTVYEQALKDTQVAWLCQQCRTPLNSLIGAGGFGRCEKCKGVQAPCPICWQRTSPFEGVVERKRKKSKHAHEKRGLRNNSIPTSAQGQSINDSATDEAVADLEINVESPPNPPTLWMSCPLCLHGGHINCLQTHFIPSSSAGHPGSSEGSCPTVGCLCDCRPGLFRDEKARRRDEIKSLREKGRVKTDEWRVGESRAVVGAAKALGTSGRAASSEGGSGERSLGAMSGSGGTTSVGASTGTARGDRRVRLVEPGGERSR